MTAGSRKLKLRQCDRLPSGRGKRRSPAAQRPSEEGKIGSRKPRKRFPRILTALFLVPFVLVLGLLLEGWLVKLPIDSENPPPAGERIGVLHIHTLASDGSGTVPEVLAAARQANVSFLSITDHNVTMTPSSIADDPPDLPIIAGEELSTNSGHFLALGVSSSWDRPSTLDDRKLLASAHAAGAFTVLAHPFHPRTPWTDWQTSDFDGLEIWNEDAAWRHNNVFDLLIALMLYTDNDQLAMVRMASMPEQSFAKWDELLAQRPVVGTCGADAHAATRLGHGLIWRFPGYEPSFAVAREHVLLAPGAGGGDASRASAVEILDSLRRGHSFCALDGLYPSSGLVTRVSSGPASGGPGDFLAWAGAGRIQISVPSGSSLPFIKIFRDGREILARQTWTIDDPIPGPGRYRAEIFLRQPGLSGWRRWTLWAFTNPVYVTPQAGSVPVNAPPH